MVAMGKRRHAPDTKYLKKLVTVINGREYWRPMHSPDILREFQKAGYPVTPTGPIPKDLAASIIIGGVAVHIRPRSIKGRRVVAFCPECHKPVCAGHIDQHMAIHTGWEYK